jgi:hypothetical protein
MADATILPDSRDSRLSRAGCYREAEATGL